MSETTDRKLFLDVFRKEWELYRQKGRELAPRVGERRDGHFDADPHSGEVRVFADTARPLIGAVLAEWDGWRIVPVSEFTVPATDREILLGKRTYRLWNAFAAESDFVARSWRVETLPAEDMRDLGEALAHVQIGAPLREDLLACTGLPIVDAADERHAYEAEFRNPLSCDAAAAAPLSRPFWRKRTAWSVAACFVVLLGLSVMLIHEQPSMLSCHEALTSCTEAQAVRNTAVDKFAAMESNAKHCSMDCGASAEPMRMEYAAQDSVAIIKSPVTMRCMAGSRNPRCALRKHAPCGPDGSTVSDTVGRERYAEIHENEFVEVSREPLSTFGLDVDTASYTTMRRYINDMRRLPPRDSVRIEEYVNYFNYDYAEPTGTVPIAVHCELAACPWNASNKLLRVGLQAKRIAKDKLPGANLVFLIDVSGSMGWNGGFDMAKGALRMLTNALRDEDFVSIVTYASGTAVRLESTSGRDKAKILGVVEGLSSGGGTSGGAGLQLAYEQAAKNFRKGANNRVILITDGDFNIGIQTGSELERFIAQKRDGGVFLTVLGVGRGNYQDGMMKKLANAGNGNYAFLDGVLEAKKVLMTEFAGTLCTVAKDVKLQLEFNPAQTAAYRLLGYESRKLAAKDFNDDKKDAGEMGAGHTMTALYELVPTGGTSAVATTDPLKYQKTTPVDSRELLTVKLRYKEPEGTASKLVESSVVAETITRKDGPSEDWRFASSVAEFALVLKDSPFKGTSSFAEVIRRAKAAKGKDENGYRAEFIRLAETAELLKQSPSADASLIDIDVDVDL